MILMVKTWSVTSVTHSTIRGMWCWSGSVLRCSWQNWPARLFGESKEKMENVWLCMPTDEWKGIIVDRLEQSSRFSIISFIANESATAIAAIASYPHRWLQWIRPSVEERRVGSLLIASSDFPWKVNLVVVLDTVIGVFFGEGIPHFSFQKSCRIPDLSICQNTLRL